MSLAAGRQRRKIKLKDENWGGGGGYIRFELISSKPVEKALHRVVEVINHHVIV